MLQHDLEEKNYTHKQMFPWNTLLSENYHLFSCFKESPFLLFEDVS